ncbi:glucokinase [Kordiimonas lacus]|jgi:glucokinase|uniref:Glucokinase n=1 Tax=Kordiimonas lacus TaxID=637679 RepID=A0A1G6ZGL9_9PROT|nr:glucokinase [Kordiimonas lacus]SDE01611.1 glucokinase [Kordiimonas lacus]
MTEITTCIVADIGGTNGRFGVATFSDGRARPEIDHVIVFPCREYGSLGQMLGAYIEKLGATVPRVAKLAIAGPTTEKKGRLTNLGWDVDADQIAQTHGLELVKFVNDFGALARACPFLEEGVDYVTLKNGAVDKAAPISVMGPGTGFGVSLLVPNGKGYHTVSTEGGFMAFAPGSRLEHDLTEHLRAELGYVSVESFLCGEGIARIYRFLVDYGGGGDRDLSPAQITKLAAEGGAPACTRAVQLFLSIVGATAGDIALVHGAKGGIFLGGGILPKIADMVGPSDLLRRFVAKGAQSAYVETIPVHLITAKYAALVGAAVA